MTAPIAIRPADAADLPALRALWDRCGLFLAALRDGEIVGSVMASWDGRRGWINRLAVDPSVRGARLGDRLMAEAEARLRAIGCDKVNLLIEPDNAGVERFYRRLGYDRDELIFMEKWL